MIKKIIVSGIFALFFSLPLPGQENIVNFKFRPLLLDTRAAMTVATGESMSEVNLYFFDGKEFIKVICSPNRIGGLYDYSGPLPLVFYKDRPAIVEEEIRPVTPPVGSISVLPNDSRKVLLTIIPTVRGGLYLSTFDRSDRVLDEGNVLAINVTLDTLALRLGSERLLLNRGQYKTMPITDLGANNGLLQVAVEESDGRDWNLVYSRTAPLTERSAYFLFVYRELLTEGRWRIASFKNQPDDSNEMANSVQSVDKEEHDPTEIEMEIETPGGEYSGVMDDSPFNY